MSERAAIWATAGFNIRALAYEMWDLSWELHVLTEWRYPGLIFAIDDAITEVWNVGHDWRARAQHGQEEDDGK